MALKREFQCSLNAHNNYRYKYITGWNRDHTWRVRRREEEDKHRHGADHFSGRLVP